MLLHASPSISKRTTFFLFFSRVKLEKEYINFCFFSVACFPLLCHVAARRNFRCCFIFLSVLRHNAHQLQQEQTAIILIVKSAYEQTTENRDPAQPYAKQKSVSLFPVFSRRSSLFFFFTTLRALGEGLPPVLDPTPQATIMQRGKTRYGK